jgi:hypothetical protein
MMASRCPNGHTSGTDDFCDVCGAPIVPTGDPAAASSGAPSPASKPASSLTLDPTPAAPAAPPLSCPNCAEENLPDALFCEKCGYDFTTGQVPAVPVPAAAAAPAADWVAEVWIDPDWFAAQEAEGRCATSGPPTVVPLPGTRALIGRASKSRDVSPQIDCSADGSVSHRQAELTLDHDRWFVEDLGSTNGTFVGSPDDPLPTTPIRPHERRELADSERIYVGAWCRIMVRRATDEEKGVSPS